MNMGQMLEDVKLAVKDNARVASTNEWVVWFQHLKKF